MIHQRHQELLIGLKSWKNARNFEKKKVHLSHKAAFHFVNRYMSSALMWGRKWNTIAHWCLCSDARSEKESSLNNTPLTIIFPQRRQWFGDSCLTPEHGVDRRWSTRRLLTECLRRLAVRSVRASSQDKPQKCVLGSWGGKELKRKNFGHWAYLSSDLTERPFSAQTEAAQTEDMMFSHLFPPCYPPSLHWLLLGKAPFFQNSMHVRISNKFASSNIF